MTEKIKNFKWGKFIFPFTTYYKSKYGIINPVLVIIDILILFIPIPFFSVVIICMVNYFLNDVNEEDK